MRFRIIALIILFVIISLPIGLYWFFYLSKVSSIAIISEKKTPYTVELQGKISYKYFPLLDRDLRFQSTCSQSCIFSPIPPTVYQIIVTSTGSEKVTDTINLKSGEEYLFQLSLTPSLNFIKVGELPPINPSLENNIVGITQGGNRVSYTLEKDNRIAIFLSQKKRENFSFVLPAVSMKLDMSRTFLVVKSNRDEQYIFSLDGREKTPFPFLEEVLFVRYDDTWKVRTPLGIYESNGAEWKKNQRFSDYIDIDSRYRIGYIDRSDQTKLSLANLPLTDSVFVLLDRKGTEMKIIKKGKDIQGFLSYEGSPTVLESDNTLSKIEIRIDMY